MSGWFQRAFDKVFGGGGGTHRMIRKTTTGKHQRRYWVTELRHEGVRFPCVPDHYDLTLHSKGKPTRAIALSSEAEEFGVMYARCMARRPALSKDDVFQRNFWSGFSTLLPAAKFINVNDSRAHDWDFARLLSDHNAARLEHTKNNGHSIPNDKVGKSMAVVDGRTVTIGKGTVDGPGIYLSRSPLDVRRGMLRRRLSPRDITVNMSHPVDEDMTKWGSVISDNTVSWIARWTDATTGKNKYVYLGDDARHAHKDQREKFDVARRYGELRGTLMKRAAADMKSQDDKVMQTAVCFFIIDAFAIRPGSSSSSSARGVTTLTASNVSVRPRTDAVALDFVGKDSIRYKGETRVPRDVVRTIDILKSRSQRKKDNRMFPLITAASLNEYLDGLMSGLTAKVIRTYRASCTYHQLLHASPAPSNAIEAESRIHAAATGAAMLCNHQNETRVCSQVFAPSKDVHASLHTLRSKILNDDLLSGTRTTQCWAKQTTLANYIDPRITYAYCKKYGVPIERVYANGLRARFKWASSSSTSSSSTSPYKFCAAL